MKKMRMCFPREKTFEDGFKEYVLDCKAKNLREGTINHYQESIKQIFTFGWIKRRKHNVVLRRSLVWEHLSWGGEMSSQQ